MQSTYKIMCHGMTHFPAAHFIWKFWALLKCKIFIWLAVQYRVWTSDRRARHGLQANASVCFTCNGDEDNVEHILMQCAYARGTWQSILEHYRIDIQTPSPRNTLVQWWTTARKSFDRRDRRGFDSLTLITTWSLWKQRNARVFGGM